MLMNYQSCDFQFSGCLSSLVPQGPCMHCFLHLRRCSVSLHLSSDPFILRLCHSHQAFPFLPYISLSLSVLPSLLPPSSPLILSAIFSSLFPLLLPSCYSVTLISLSRLCLSSSPSNSPASPFIFPLPPSCCRRTLGSLTYCVSEPQPNSPKVLSCSTLGLSFMAFIITNNKHLLESLLLSSFASGG